MCHHFHRLAFDSVHRGKVLKILKAYGITDAIEKAINVMYSDTQAVVLSPDGETDASEILAGVLKREQAENLLSRIETAADSVGLQMNDSKTKFMAYNIKEDVTMVTTTGSLLEQVEDFQNLGSWVDESEKDFKIHNTLAWKACNKMRTLWKSALPASLKISFFRAAVESILLYGAEGWTITNKLETRLDACYTRLLILVLYLDWKDYPTREEIYGNLPKVSKVVRERRLNFAARCSRRRNEPVSELVFWMPSQLTRA